MLFQRRTNCVPILKEKQRALRLKGFPLREWIASVLGHRFENCSINAFILRLKIGEDS